MRLFVALAVFAVVAVSAAPLLETEYEFFFTKWAAQHGKQYEADQFFAKYNVFKANLDMILEHNSANHSYTMAMNEFGDLTWEEFRSMYVGFGGVPQKTWDSETRDFSEVDQSLLAASIDWVAAGAVTPVKNQGQCGSCWAFSTTGGLEGAYAIKHKSLVSFSEQELVDCDNNGDQGCNGGLMDNAFGWIQKNGGLCTEASYPYKATGGTCKKSSCTSVAGSAPTKWVDVAHTESAMLAAVNLGPVSIAIEADQSGFQFYSSGVFTGTCGTSLDHGVLNVGYGTLGSTDYWKVKNSWGSGWGMGGYILLQRGKAQSGGQCGLLLSASYPVL